MPDYKVTGTLRNGQRFKAIHTKNFSYAMGINLWKGSVYQKSAGKWVRIKEVWN